MIQREGVGYEMYCDECNEELGVCEDTFQDAVREARNAGWAVFKSRGEWRHLCHDCRAVEDAAREFGGIS